MPSAGFLIYSGIMPLIKTYLSIFCGYYLARKDLFPPAAARGASQVTMNVSLPLLVFANIVPAFTQQNISALGPLFLVAFVYMIIGFLSGALIREFCYVPRNFWQGIIVVTGMSNWGNLPNAVVLSVTQQAPFDPTTDPQLGVSFVSIFIVSYHLVFWVCGAAHSLSWDYLPGIPQGTEAERHCSWREKPIANFILCRILGQSNPAKAVDTASRRDSTSVLELGDEKYTSQEASDAVAGPSLSRNELGTDPDVQLVRRMSRMSAISHHTLHPSTIPTVLDSSPPLEAEEPEQLPPAGDNTNQGRLYNILPSIIIRSCRPLAAVFTPVTIAIAISLPIALIKPLKALFVESTDGTGPHYHGPDGKPPLAFIIDTANFVGNIAIPLALILLGASFARLRIPRPLSRLPIIAMLAVATFKMAVLPVFGVAVVQAMTTGGLISKESKAERFVAMFLSGTPAAVNQLIVASLYAPDGDVDTLSAFLLVQYIFMFFSSSALTAISLLLL